MRRAATNPPGVLPTDHATTLVAMKPIVEGMGLDWKGQHAKIAAHPILSQGMEMISIPSSGGPQDMICIPLNRLNFWMATIQPNRVPAGSLRRGFSLSGVRRLA